MIRQIFKKLKHMDNSGSTMVEVLAGFTILVVVLVGCSVHLLGTAGNMIMEAKDMQSARETVNSELYKKDADYETINGAQVSLMLDKTKTKEENYNLTSTSKDISLSATIKRFHNDTANLTIIHIDKATDSSTNGADD